MAAFANTTNKCFINRWNREKQQEVQLYGRLYGDKCNIQTYLLQGLSLTDETDESEDEFLPDE
jgi:hypothetical protein